MSMKPLFYLIMTSKYESSGARRLQGVEQGRMCKLWSSVWDWSLCSSIHKIWPCPVSGIPWGSSDLPQESTNIVTFHWQNPANSTLTKCLQLALPAKGWREILQPMQSRHHGLGRSLMGWRDVLLLIAEQASCPWKASDGMEGHSATHC